MLGLYIRVDREDNFGTTLKRVFEIIFKHMDPSFSCLPSDYECIDSEDNVQLPGLMSTQQVKSLVCDEKNILICGRFFFILEGQLQNQWTHLTSSFLALVTPSFWFTMLLR